MIAFKSQTILCLTLLVANIGALRANELDIHFEKALAGADDYYFYQNSDIGTPAISENLGIIYLGSDKKIHLLSTDNDRESVIGTDIEAMFQIGSCVYVKSGRDYYELIGNEFIKIPDSGDVSPSIPLSDSVYFSFYRGLQSVKDDGEHYTLAEGIRSGLRHLHGVPQISADGKYIYLVQKTSDDSGDLTRVDADTGDWQVIQHQVKSFAIDDQGRIIVYSLQSEHTRMRHNLWPGDFIHIDPITHGSSSTLDMKGYEEGWEYIINSFVCRDGMFVAYGGYFEIENGEISSSSKSVLRMSYSID